MKDMVIKLEHRGIFNVKFILKYSPRFSGPMELTAKKKRFMRWLNDKNLTLDYIKNKEIPITQKELDKVMGHVKF